MLVPLMALDLALNGGMLDCKQFSFKTILTGSAVDLSCGAFTLFQRGRERYKQPATPVSRITATITARPPLRHSRELAGVPNNNLHIRHLAL